MSVSSGNVTNYMHAPRGLVGRRMKAGEQGSRASAAKVVGSVVRVVALSLSDLNKM